MKTITRKSKCHRFRGSDYEPEALSPAWSRANYRPRIAESLDNNRPGAVPLGSRPIHKYPVSIEEKPYHLRNRAKIHWIDGNCGSPLHRITYPLNILKGFEFNKMANAEPGRCCIRCLDNFQRA